MEDKIKELKDERDNLFKEINKLIKEENEKIYATKGEYDQKLQLVRSKINIIEKQIKSLEPSVVAKNVRKYNGK